jgi:hypothetical protein
MDSCISSVNISGCAAIARQGALRQRNAVYATMSRVNLRRGRRRQSHDAAAPGPSLLNRPASCTLHVFAAGLIGRLAGRASLPGATFCPLCHEYLGGTRAPVGWPRCKSSGELRLERQYRD